MRIGLGYDVHAFAEDRRSCSAACEIAHDRGLAGHSDADVLAHALMDALDRRAARGRHRPAVPGHGPAVQGRGLAGASRAAWRDSWRERGFVLVDADCVLVLERAEDLAAPRARCGERSPGARRRRRPRRREGDDHRGPWLRRAAERASPPTRSCCSSGRERAVPPARLWRWPHRGATDRTTGDGQDVRPHSQTTYARSRSAIRRRPRR